MTKNVNNLFPIHSTQTRLSLQNQFSLETSIEGEAKELFGAWIRVDYSLSFRGFLLNKGMLILHLYLTFHLESSSQSFQNRSYDQTSLSSI